MWGNFSSISVLQWARIRGIDGGNLVRLRGKVSFKGFEDDVSFEFKLILNVNRRDGGEILRRGPFEIDILRICQSIGILLGYRLETARAPGL